MTAHIRWSKEGNSSIQRYPERKRDDYGFEVKSYRRHKMCRCTTPCQGRFSCAAVDHVGRRAVPYCRGASDDEPSFCDNCWLAKQGMVKTA